MESIREYKQQKREWQERINKELDAKEEEIRRIKESRDYEIAKWNLLTWNNSLFDREIAMFQEKM